MWFFKLNMYCIWCFGVWYRWVFYGLCCILRSPPGLIKIQRTGKNIQRYYTKTTTKLFIIQLFKANELQTTKNVWQSCACGARSATKLGKLVLYCTISCNICTAHFIRCLYNNLYSWIIMVISTPAPVSKDIFWGIATKSHHKIQSIHVTKWWKGNEGNLKCLIFSCWSTNWVHCKLKSTNQCK